jgi:regulator of protease activity HflC (stomatin/prohibitin superfamily)
MLGFHVITQYEQGLVFKWGKLQAKIHEPGLIWLNPFSRRLVRVNMQTVVAAVPAQEAITRDNVTLTVDAVVYFRVVDPVKAVINVQNYHHAISQVAQTSLRSVIGHADMDELLSERERVNAELKKVIDEPTEGPWGIHIERVEVKDVALPDSMKRSMSRQAEAERERRARVISADGEFQASAKLAEAAQAMAATPGALQLRLLQTIVEVAADKNSTLVMPFPVELLRFFDQSTKSTASATAAAEALLAAQLSAPVSGEVAGPIAAPVSAAPAALAAFPVPAPPPASAGATNGTSGPVVR